MNFLPPFFYSIRVRFVFFREIGYKNNKSCQQLSSRKQVHVRSEIFFKSSKERERSDHSNGSIKMKARRNYLVLIFAEWTGRIIRKIITTKFTIHGGGGGVQESIFLPSFLSFYFSSPSLFAHPSPVYPTVFL